MVDEVTRMRVCPQCNNYHDSTSKYNKAKCEDCKEKNNKIRLEKMEEYYAKRRGKSVKRKKE